MSASDNNIKVVCRFRPQNSIEDREGGEVIVSIDDSNTSCRVESKEYPGQFNFDQIFDWTCQQSEIFEYCGKSLVDQCFEGFNSTLFAYGQTGSGKTYTMMGADLDDSKTKGMTPRLVEYIFDKILQAPSTLEFTVKVSFLEIYMEKIRDLLSPLNDNLAIHEDKSRGVYVKGLKEIYVSAINEVFEVMRMGDQSRKVSATNMNEQSSRSHSLFIITINQKDLQTGSSKSGKLYLVDLAGSEKVGKTGATGQTLEEAKKINKSLTALGMVINALTDGKSTHVPYRDSKLTRILQESLGGNSKTTLIINCSPSSYNDAETISTLRFGTRAKSIKNRAHVNVELSVNDLKALLKSANSQISSFQSYISLLESEVEIWRFGGKVEKEDWAQQGQKQSTSSLKSPSEKSHIDSNDLLQKEIELNDLLAEKEDELEKYREEAQKWESEADKYKESEAKLLLENKELLKKQASIQMEMEKLIFEHKDTDITIESLKEQNKELETRIQALQEELQSLRQQMIQLSPQSDSKEQSNLEKEKLKSEKTAEMMKTFVDQEEDLNKKEQELKAALSSFDISGDEKENKTADQNKTPEWIKKAEQFEQQLQESQDKYDQLLKEKSEIQKKCDRLEEELAELLDKAIEDEQTLQRVETKVTDSVLEFKTKLEKEYEEKVKKVEQELETVKQDLQKKSLELELAKQTKEDSPNASTDLEKLKKLMSKQLTDFEMMRKSLMRDLQNRCEKVVELEISLDETREQYNQVLRNSNLKAQQKKMSVLERNLDQLTKVQKQLVEQNTFLKRSLEASERKILNRNDRISDLEKMLQEMTNSLTIHHERHATEQADMEKKVQELDQLNQQLKRGFTFGEGRIAKPLRGGVPKETTDSNSSSPTRGTSAIDWLPNLLKN